MLIGSLRSVLLVWYLSSVLYLGLVPSPPRSGLMCFPSVGDDWLRMASGRTSSRVMALFHSFSVVALSLAPVTVSGCLMGLIGIDGIIHTS